MTVSDLIRELQAAPPNALVFYRGSLDVLQPLEFAGLISAERAHYEDQDDRPAESRSWFDAGTLTDRIRKIERVETVQAFTLKREAAR
jgi:hypothetical protein